MPSFIEYPEDRVEPVDPADDEEPSVIRFPLQYSAESRGRTVRRRLGEGRMEGKYPGRREEREGRDEGESASSSNIKILGDGVAGIEEGFSQILGSIYASIQREGRSQPDPVREVPDGVSAADVTTVVILESISSSM